MYVFLLLGEDCCLILFVVIFSFWIRDYILVLFWRFFFFVMILILSLVVIVFNWVNIVFNWFSVVWFEVILSCNFNIEFNIGVFICIGRWVESYDNGILFLKLINRRVYDCFDK